MPTYTFKDEFTQEEETLILSLSEREQYIKDNPHKKQCLSIPALGDSVRLGVTKTPDGFQDLLKNAKKGNRNSTIQTRT